MPRGRPFQGAADPRRSNGRPAGVPNKLTVAVHTARVPTRAELAGIEGAFHGTAREFLEGVMRSPVFPLQLRLACANSLVRNEPPSQPTDFSQLSREQLEEQVIDLNARCYSEEEWAERCRKVSCRREELKAAGLYPHDARNGHEHPERPVINGHAQPEAKGPPGGDKARSAAGGEY